ncbi:MAG: hypothetical protein IJW55_04285 [Clostridia bacterium]|nr:hypothetical protein [Clostridia bacterium]
MIVVHDVHTHNVFSHCCTDRTASTAAYMQKETELGMKVFGLSNHIWDESVKGCSYWYSHQTISLAEEAKASFANAPAGLKCLFGAESEYYGCFDRLGMSVEGAKRFDYLIIPHSHLHMRNEVMSDFPEIIEIRKRIEAEIREACPYLEDDTVKVMMSSLKEAHLKKYVPEMTTDLGRFNVRAAIDNFLALVENETFRQICKTVPTSIAHPFGLCGVSNSLKNGYLQLIDDATLHDCFARAKKIGAYVEINTGAVKECGLDLAHNGLMRVFAIAKEEGCQFTFGSDSHSVKALEVIKVGNDVCKYLGLTPSDIAEYLRDGVIE